MPTFLLAVAMGALPTLLVFAWVYADELLADREDARRRTEQGRDVTPEWVALLAAVEPERPALPQRRPTNCTPITDALVCARIEKEEGWTA